MQELSYLYMSQLGLCTGGWTALTRGSLPKHADFAGMYRDRGYIRVLLGLYRVIGDI